MKLLSAISFHRKNQSGSVRLPCLLQQLEEDEDLWLLYNMLVLGDRITSRTSRKIKLESSGGNVNVTVKKMVLELELTKIDFSPKDPVIRLTGKNCTEHDDVKLGAFHTLELSVPDSFKLFKHDWDFAARSALRSAADLHSKAEVAAVLISPGEAALYLMTTALVKECGRVACGNTKSKNKLFDKSDRVTAKYFERIVEAMIVQFKLEKPLGAAAGIEHGSAASAGDSGGKGGKGGKGGGGGGGGGKKGGNKPSGESETGNGSGSNSGSGSGTASTSGLKTIILGSTAGDLSEGFLSHFQEMLAKRSGETGMKNLAPKLTGAVSCVVANIGKTALAEALAEPAVSVKLAASKAVGEVAILDKFLKLQDRDATSVVGKRTGYGIATVVHGLNMGAIEKLLISDALTRSDTVKRRHYFSDLMDSVTDCGGSVQIFSSLGLCAEKIKGLADIAAIFRYPLHDLDEVDITDIPQELR